MNAFIDPRANPVPEAEPASPRTTTAPDELEDLHRLCREGRLYDVERWIQTGRPLQLAEGTPPPKGRWSSALEIALEAGNQALTLLLLCNGYGPNLECSSPLDLALRARRFDLLDLLLAWGADPQSVDLYDLFGTYQLDLFERFRTLGVDLTSDHVLAETLAHHTSNKPLFGYAKRHLEHNPKLQVELNIALAHHAREGNEKGVALCLWAGGDPHAPAPDLRYPDRTEEDEDVDEDDRFEGFSAVHEACSYGHVEILKRLGPHPGRDDFDELYRAADSSAVIDLLAQSALPKDVASVIEHHLLWLSFDFGYRSWRSLYPLRHVFEVGARWESSTPDEIARLRRSVLKTSRDTFVDLMKLLTTRDYCSPEILHELARTPAMRRRMKEVGFIPSSPDDPGRPSRHRPTRSREVLKKCGVELPKPPLPTIVRIGPWRRDGRKIQLDRPGLFELVWSKPVSRVAKEWGLSGRGLSKACRRLNVPTPPRGYWARIRAGKRVRRPQLPKLAEGEAEEIIICAPQQDQPADA